jgi:hypothetical protein
VAQDANRDIIVDYIKAQKNLTQANQGAKPNWKFVTVVTKGNVLLNSSSDANALNVAKQDGITHLTKYKDGAVSFTNGQLVFGADATSAVYKVDLSYGSLN